MEFHLLSNEKPIQMAAKELKNYLTRMGSEEILPKSWELGVQDMTEYGLDVPEDPKLDDAYFFRVDEEEACIYGSNPRSVLLGVYRYLTEIGCRFLRPGAEYEIVPEKRDTEGFFALCAHKASLRHRGACIEGATSVENVLDFIDWSPKIGFNSLFPQFKYPHEFFRRWYEHVRNPKMAPQSWSMEQSIAADRIISEAMEMRGMMQHRVGHGWTGEALGYTATGWETDDTEIAPEKKSLLAEVNGKRELFGGVPTNTNLCYSNPAVVELYCEKVLDYVKEHPEADYLHVWLADLFNNVCECEECRKKILTDHYIHMLNAIDAKLTEAGYGTKLVFLLYQELLWAPQTEQLNNPDRFVLMFAPISRTFMKSYAQAGELSPTPEYVLNKITLPVSMEENMAFLKDWQQKVSCDSFVYDYHLGKCHYGDFGYVHLSKVLCEDLKQNKELGLNGINSCQELRAFLPNALPNYVMGLVSVDTDLEFDAVAMDYYASAYGEYGHQVLAYLEEISNNCDMDYFVGRGEAVNPAMAERFENILRALEEFAPLIGQVLTDPALPTVQRRFWRELSYHQAYTFYLTHALLAKAKGEDYVPAYRTFCDLVRDSEPDFQKSLDGYRILEVTNNYTKLHE